MNRSSTGADGADGTTTSVRVAFQGEAGAFSEEAIHACFGWAAVEAVPRPDFAGIGRAVLDGVAEYGMLPVENSIAGSVTGSYDVLASEPLTIVGEIVRPIRLCLLALPATKMSELRRVLSHPVALAQCQRFLSELSHADALAVHDTAGAARIVRERGDAETAAVAGRLAAEHYGLEVLAEDIQDRADNQTRFFVVASRGTPPLEGGEEGGSRTALLLETAHRPGALVDALLPFAQRGVNLTRIESRPSGEPWHYRFFIELDTAADDAPAMQAIQASTERAHRLHVLGSFRRLA